MHKEFNYTNNAAAEIQDSALKSCAVVMSHRALRYIVLSQCPCFFSYTYVLHIIRKGFWCRLNTNSASLCVRVSVRPSAGVLTL